MTDDAVYTAKCRAEIERGKAWLAKEIARLEAFLAKVSTTRAKESPELRVLSGPVLGPLLLGLDSTYDPARTSASVLLLKSISSSR